MGKGGDKVQSNKISLEELSKHRTPQDGTYIHKSCSFYISLIYSILLFINNLIAWVSYRNKVYDVSNWNDHPGMELS